MIRKKKERKGKGRDERGGAIKKKKSPREAGKLCFVREKEIKRNQPGFKGRISIIAL